MQAGAVLRAYVRVGNPQAGFRKQPVPAGQAGRRPLIAGNWKMNPVSYREAQELLRNVQIGVRGITDVDILVAPPFPYLGLLQGELEKSGDGNINLGAQGVYWEEKGAFTGEVSSQMLCDLGIEYALIGHSERRQLFGETDEKVNRKVKAALAAGLIPIVCAGERLSQRQEGLSVVSSHLERQVIVGLEGIEEKDRGRVVLAYEPIWAIGAGKTPATPDQAEEVQAFLRRIVWNLWGEGIGRSLRILYGGNVKPDNIAAFMEKDNVDGALVGGASLDADSFAKIVRFGLPA